MARQGKEVKEMFTVTTQARTAGGATTTTVRINWKPVILIAIALLVVGGMIGYLVSSRSGGETIRISAEEQARNERVLQGKATQEDLRQIEREAKEAEKEILRAIGQSATTPAPTTAPPAATTAGVPKWALGSWTRTFDTKYSKVTVKYTETASAKGKVAVWLTVNKNGDLDRHVQDVSDKPVAGYWKDIIRDASGKVVDSGTNLRMSLAPGEKQSDWYMSTQNMDSGDRVEIWFEVN